MSNLNKELNKSTIWIDKKCVSCNRKYPDTILNIEGYIHHKTKLLCINTRSCNRARKKLKGKT